MGGTHSSNLMSDVNVLIVGDKNTEKYKFSVKNRFDISFIKPDAILKIHNHWINNEDRTNPELIKVDTYRLPIFENLSICLSRISLDSHISTFDKENFIKIIKENGGQVSDSLTTTSSCLITNEKSGRRYEMSKKWQIPIIHPLWILHSVKRKASLDFQYYNIELIQDENNIGEDSCKVWDNLRKHKRKKIVLDEEEEKEKPKELKENVKKNSEIWNSIMKNNNKEQILAKRNVSSWDENINEDENINNPEKITIDLNKKSRPNLEVTRSRLTPVVTSHLFKNQSFQILMFDDSKKATLTKVIESHSGSIFSDNNDEENPKFIIIPSNFPIDDLPKHLMKYELITEWFVERCLHYNKLIVDDWGRPFYKSNMSNRPNLPKLNISITGFQGIELLHTIKLIELSGFRFHEVLNGDRDLLIINIETVNIGSSDHTLLQKYPSLFTKSSKDFSKTTLNSTKKKIRFAKQKSIPIVSISFILSLLKENHIGCVNSRQWCIYCPSAMRIKESLISLVEINPNKSTSALNNDQNDNNQLKKADLESPTRQPSIPQLPSPIRNKRKDNWGRLVGRASKSQLDSLEMQQPTADPIDQIDNDQATNSTQISYEQSQTNDKLLKLLNRENEDPNTNKRKIPNIHHTTSNHNTNDHPRKRTRAGYKEMVDVLDDN
ncbi:S-M checkpoint control protein [Wickerhamomyces ciferrii]|uniref:S-M checkpoint control protein n=1 Tax=Wickerhamomyces ciferrii (strain ATCC 14091 / BCRC 22168 / CBS 111 / JCM 3599 / NBRC 0793 / NRRL Y-1031 F-60-10) TaxID=1206466 RepID=K0KKQ9_WICCF|nr:S-M checkpoint control protein [Wickerhamomyces ciferrii]CCH42054.1 S-M checkpoint control protein [Wickerhamomyces ciferrii]